MHKLVKWLSKWTSLFIICIMILSGLIYLLVMQRSIIPDTGRRLADAYYPTYYNYSRDELERLRFDDSCSLWSPSFDGPEPGEYSIKLDFEFFKWTLFPIRWIRMNVIIQLMDNVLGPIFFNFTLNEQKTGFYYDLNFNETHLDVPITYEIAFPAASTPLHFYLNFSVHINPIAPPITLQIFVNQFILFF